MIHALRQEEADRDLAKCNTCLFSLVLFVSVPFNPFVPNYILKKDRLCSVAG